MMGAFTLIVAPFVLGWYALKWTVLITWMLLKTAYVMAIVLISVGQVIYGKVRGREVRWKDLADRDFWAWAQPTLSFR